MSHEIVTRFPGVNWTGGSGIHRSYTQHFTAKKIVQTAEGFAYLFFRHYAKDLAAYLYKKTTEFFQDTEMLLPYSDWETLFFSDVLSQTYGHGWVQSAKMKVNPNTGNHYHRVAADEKFVVALRVFFPHNAGSAYTPPTWPNDLGLWCRWGVEVDKGSSRDKMRQVLREMVEEEQVFVDEKLAALASMQIPEYDAVMETEKPPRAHEAGF